MDISKYLLKNNLYTGRGATAIYLAFKNEKLEGIDVLVPGNICYAAVYPIIYSGNNPVFCDVDRDTGNITLEIIKKSITNKVKAILIPHMYGNTVNNLDEIKSECENNSIILIEDIASSFGSCNSKYGKVGRIGDYVIGSFGYSKTIDLGNGGVLSSNKDLMIAKSELDKLPFYESNIEDDEKKISKLYRRIRNKEFSYKEIKKIDFNRQLLYRDDSFVNKLDDRKIKESIEMHLHNYSIYEKIIDTKYRRYKYNEGSVPWRFSLLLDIKTKSIIINSLLNEGLPVSDWYPNVTEFFLDKKEKLENVDKMEEEIINFPLDIEISLIEKICYTINMVK